MPEERYRFQALEIVGFAAKPPPELTPRVVPPIFRLQHETDTYITPPYRLEAETVRGGRTYSWDELQNLKLRGNLELMGDPQKGARANNQTILVAESELTILFPNSLSTRAWIASTSSGARPELIHRRTEFGCLLRSPATATTR
jgi:hypothetical protein